MAEAELYVPRKHLVRPRKVWALGKDAMVKFYSMMPEDMPDLDDSQFNEILSHVQREVVDGRIDIRSGLGFLIASEGVANLTLWGGKFPSLMNQTVYSFDPKTVAEKPEFNRESLEESGTFCCYEGVVVGHESLAWRRFLFSPQSLQDRRTYLGDQFRGVAGPHYSEC